MISYKPCHCYNTDSGYENVNENDNKHNIRAQQGARLLCKIHIQRREVYITADRVDT